MAGVFLGLMIGLELKHYVADYFLQPGWMLGGKGNVFHPGGYAHAGLHAALSLLVLLVMGTPVGLAFALFAGEFVVHYALDYAKIHYSTGVYMDNKPHRFWVLHGVDQIFHQLTYVAMIYIVMRAMGAL
ncbi:MAG TPA: DUF3307 domain-containing protein [Devosia sp.]|jgi:hypothetical protein|nr:DUF3307 domain-containing protein [Devosia sp.]